MHESESQLGSLEVGAYRNIDSIEDSTIRYSLWTEVYHAIITQILGGYVMAQEKST